MQKNFFNIQRGDTIKIGAQTHTVIGKSLGRNWCAIRTDKGLVDVRKDQSFEVVGSKK